MRKNEKQNEQIWRSSVLTVSLVSTVELIAFFAFLSKAPPLAGPDLGFLAALLIVLCALWAFRKRPGPEVSHAALFLTTALVLAQVSFNHQYYFRMGVVFEPFAGEKLYALALGIIAPPVFWSGFAAILLTGLVPIVQFLMLHPQVREKLPLQEPWMTWIYIVVALVLYEFRRRSQAKLQQRTAQAEERAILLQEFVKLVIDAQHLANTPLQTIENTVAVLQARLPEEREMMAPMERALEQIQKIMRLLTHCDCYVNWQEMSLPDSLEEFEQRLKDLVGHGNWKDSKD
jgi:hypothetical protein